MKNIKKMKLSSSLLLLGLLLSVAACGSCDDEDDGKDGKKNDDKKEEKKPLKFTITGAKIEKAIQANKSETGEFKIEVTEGEDKTDEYKIKLGTLETFKTDNYANGPGEANDKKVKLTVPTNGATLKSLGVGDTLKKGDKKDITFTFTAAATKQSTGSSQVDVSIVDKDGKVVGGPVKLQWNHA
jgi:hypothetical protein